MADDLQLESTKIQMTLDGRMDRRNAAKYLGIAQKTLEMYALNGIGPNYTKRGRCWYYKDDLDTWLKQGMVQNAG